MSDLQTRAKREKMRRETWFCDIIETAVWDCEPFEIDDVADVDCCTVRVDATLPKGWVILSDRLLACHAPFHVNLQPDDRIAVPKRWLDVASMLGYRYVRRREFTLTEAAKILAVTRPTFRKLVSRDAGPPRDAKHTLEEVLEVLGSPAHICAVLRRPGASEALRSIAQSATDNPEDPHWVNTLRENWAELRDTTNAMAVIAYAAKDVA